MIGSKLSEQFVHPLIVGGLGYLGAQLIGEGNKVTFVGGMRISVPLFIGTVTGASSAVGETLKQWVLPIIPGNVSYSSVESTFLGPALVGE